MVIFHECGLHAGVCNLQSKDRAPFCQLVAGQGKGMDSLLVGKDRQLVFYAPENRECHLRTKRPGVVKHLSLVHRDRTPHKPQGADVKVGRHLPDGRNLRGHLASGIA